MKVVYTTAMGSVVKAVAKEAVKVIPIVMHLAADGKLPPSMGCYQVQAHNHQ